jgi:hypothetical protein
VLVEPAQTSHGTGLLTNGIANWKSACVVIVYQLPIGHSAADAVVQAEPHATHQLVGTHRQSQHIPQWQLLPDELWAHIVSFLGTYDKLVRHFVP